ncbi:FG-GAP-like repeat-containing protein [Cognataquiflexum rubidum]|uniref:FG-GAP-like repeat-containing protein n=1 Tax=Cognataquiflexum rubidum TaxID=2922273 RepID=UPI001F12BAF5|nr:FG-GAP-like repeat-containing protein [Cognataquiflexum rubidum]MCH6234382.1 FG-GAP-like repeat-containing protein [Cognataquiflexum rubidum]
MLTILIFLFLQIPQVGLQPTFEAQTIDDKVAIGYGLAIGDVDGDGKPDILLADKKQFVWYRNGDWKRFVMIENLTEYDNVCIAARDINGDGKVEVAVGAQWNPSETTDSEKSGSVHYLIRPEDPTQKWTAVKLHHEPTTHRMRWAKTNDNNYQLIVLPLHGRGNRMGQGAGVKVMAYQPPKDPNEAWTTETIDASLHLTHNMDIADLGDGSGESILVGGREGVKVFSFKEGKWTSHSQVERLIKDHAVGEVRFQHLPNGKKALATVEPMHGNMVVAYEMNDFIAENHTRTALDSTLAEGHALGWGDFLGNGSHQIVGGWRIPNKEGDFGIRIYIPQSGSFEKFAVHWIDKNGMATEDLQVADLDGDGKPEIIASGRSTNNLKIYWNRNR